MSNSPDVAVRWLGGLALILLGTWIVHSFLTLLAWAVVLGIAAWPVYKRLRVQLDANNGWTALIPTLLIALMILAPLIYGLTRLVTEAEGLAKILQSAQHAGIVAPPWLGSLPGIGPRLEAFWAEYLGTPQAARETLHWMESGEMVRYLRDLAGQILHRAFGIFITLLAVFFVFRDGEILGRQVLETSRKWFGATGVRYAVHAVAAVSATVNGLVLVALGEGLLLGFGYAFAGLGQPAILGAITGVLALIPFAAKLVFGICALVLLAQGHVAAGISLFVFGFVVVVIADNYVRPTLIGGAVRLPFLWTLLGILGGLENFGLIGIFLGPTVMAVLMSIWRDWVEGSEG
jgi:predicted PurR-regulated permease PerM